MHHRYYNGYTPLHLAIVKMQPAIVERLIESAGVGVNLVEDKNHATPLHIAMERLIECKACSISASRLLDLQQVEYNDAVMQ